MTDAPGLSAEAVGRLARKICASESEIWDEAPQSFRDRWIREAIAAMDDLPAEVARLRKEIARLRAEIAAAERKGVTVNPLVWIKHPLGYVAGANRGPAYIIDTRMKGHFTIVKGLTFSQDFDTLEEAKAAAQADFEARILAAIHPLPPSTREGE